MEPTIVVAGLIGMLALVKTVVDYLRELVALLMQRGDPATVLHRTVAFVAGLAVVWLYGASQLGDFAIPGTKLLLTDVNGATKAIVGLTVGGLASLVTDYLKARDATRTLRVRPLIARPPE